jgi:hypothetical protein
MSRCWRRASRAAAGSSAERRVLSVRAVARASRKPPLIVPNCRSCLVSASQVARYLGLACLYRDDRDKTSSISALAQRSNLIERARILTARDPIGVPMASRLAWITERHVCALILMFLGVMLVLQLPDRLFDWFVGTVMQVRYTADPNAAAVPWPAIGGVMFVAGLVIWNWRIRFRRPS